MYNKLLWFFLVGVFIFIVLVGLASAQEQPRFVPAYQLANGDVVSIDVNSVKRQEQTIYFISRVASSPTDHQTSTVTADCKSKKYTFWSHLKQLDGDIKFRFVENPTAVKSKKKTIMRDLIESVCRATKPVN